MQKFTSSLKKAVLFPLLLFLLLATTTQLGAEGTSSLAPAIADEAAIFIGAGNTGFDGGDYGLFAWKGSNSKLYFNIQNTCEKAYFGFSIPLNNRRFIGVEEGLIFRIIDPNGLPINDISCFGNTVIDGEVWQTLDSTTVNISNRSQADNGPIQLGNAGGYTAFELDLSACGITLKGNYSIEFYTTTLPYNPNIFGAGFFIQYFDITVADCANTGLTGRVWSNNWGLGVKNDRDVPFDRAFNGRFYVCSNDGFITKIDFNSLVNTRAEVGKNTNQRSGFRAGAFNISFNTTGTNNSGNVLADRMSLPNINSPNPELPIFLNRPDEALCVDVRIGQFQTAITFLTGCPTERCINILVSEPGQLDILIEGPNGNGIFDDPSERRLAYVVTSNDLVDTPENPDFPYEVCVPWDGEDGNGNLIALAEFTITGFYSQGVYHFPIYDAEFNDDGFIVETIRPALGQQLLFYDDTLISEENNTGEPKDGSNGCVGPCHRWTGEWEDIPNRDDVYGNFNTINTWWFANTNAKDFTNNINRLQPPSIVCPADFHGCPGTSTEPSITGMATSVDSSMTCPIIIDYTDTIVDAFCGSQTITRTWKAYFQDLPDQAVECTQIITLADTTAPVPLTQPIDVNGQCATHVPPVVSLTAKDNCDGNITADPVDKRTDGNCPNSFIIIRTWVFTDNCGNTDSVSQNIIIEDTIAPVPPNPPTDVNGQCAEEIPTIVSLTAMDNCDRNITVDPVDRRTDGDCPNSFTIIRTWVFTDSCGNADSVSQNIIIKDTTAPIPPNPPADVNGQCAEEVPTAVSLTAMDNCDGSITVNPVDKRTDGNCPNSFTIIRTWVFTDSCGNTDSVSQNIIIEDTTAPVPPNPPADVNGQCAEEIPTIVSLTAMDNCDGNITVDPVDKRMNGDCPSSFTIIRTWVFTDSCGNADSVSQNIIIEDTTAPVPPNPPTDVNGQCAEEVPVVISLTAIDNCDGNITVNPVDKRMDGDCPNSFIIIRTWVFTDSCGNADSVSQNISIEDTTAPVLPIPPADINGQCPVYCPPDVPAVSLTAIDNCDGSITVNPVDKRTDGNCPNSFTIIRTWVFTDNCGNTDSISQNITIYDNTPPVTPTSPADVNGQCAEEVPVVVSLTAIDNCDGSITVDPVDKRTDGNCPNSFTIIRTWVFTDNCGNTDSISQNININDNTPPVTPTPPADVNRQCAEEVPAVVSLTAIDNCDGSITVNPVDKRTDGNCPNSFTIIRTWVFTDNCGNTDSISQNISINDNTPPVTPTPPADINGQCATDVPAVVSLTAIDNCGGIITANPVDKRTDGDCPNSFTIIRTWVFTDNCGNTDSISQNISIHDNTPPVTPTPPADVNRQCAEDVPTVVSLTAIDNCDGGITVAPVDKRTDGDCPNSFTIIRTWVFTDNCGNADSISQNISINDNTPPVTPTPPEDINGQCAEEANGQCPADIPAVSLTAIDNCDGSITVDPVDRRTDGGCPNSFTIIRTWVFTDNCGNTDSVSQNINIEDNTPPVPPTPPADITECLDNIPEGVSLTAIDNCDGAITVNSVDEETEGAIVRTWTFTDACGNSSSISQNIAICLLRQIPEGPFCTFTQRFYGNPGGKFEGQTTIEILEDALAKGPITIGQPGHSLTLINAACIIELLPRGEKSAVLPNRNTIVDNNCNLAPITTRKNDAIRNMLIAQVITLTLNTRFHDNLNALPLANVCFKIPQIILTALPTDPTVSDLLAYANAVLAGVITQNLSTVNEVVSGINETFDKCASACNLLENNGLIDNSSKQPPIDLANATRTFTIAPNPAFSTTSIDLRQFKGQTVHLAVINKIGKQVYKKRLEVKEATIETINVQPLTSGLYFLTVQSEEEGAIYTKKLVVSTL